MNHSAKYYQRVEVARMADYRGLGLRKCGHLFQVFSKKLGTLYQSHNIMEVKDWLRQHKSFYTSDMTQFSVDTFECPVKYGKVIQL